MKITFLLLAVPTFLAHAKMDMKGGCESYKANMKHEFALWDKKSAPTDGMSNVLLDRKTDLALQAAAKVQLAAPPRKLSDSPFAGIFSLEIKEDGIYRVSAGDKIWLDIVDLDTKKAIERDHFEMKMECKVMKMVAFPLKAGKNMSCK